MQHTSSPPVARAVARRGFLVRLSQATAALSALLVDPGRLDSATAPAPLSGNADPDAWIARLKGQQKVMIHAHQYFMTALVDARNMLANARDMYGVPEAQHSIAVVTHGPAIQGLVSKEVRQHLTDGRLRIVPLNPDPELKDFGPQTAWSVSSERV